jgi:hypothetical protein
LVGVGVGGVGGGARVWPPCRLLGRRREGESPSREVNGPGKKKSDEGDLGFRISFIHFLPVFYSLTI